MAGDTCQRFHIFCIHLVQFGNPVEDAIEFTGKLFLPVFGNMDASEPCNFGNGGLVNRHGAVLCAVTKN